MNLSINIESESLRLEYTGLRKNVNALRDKCGVYVFYDSLNNPIYVGMSRNLRKRLLVHSYGSNVDLSNANYCVVHITSDVGQADMLETHLINELKPELNISKAAFHEFVVSTEDRLGEVEYEIENLERELEEIQTELYDYSDEDGGFDDLGEHLHMITEKSRMESEIVRLKRLTATLKMRGARSLSNMTAEEQAANERKRRSVAFLSRRQGGAR
jgi:hypothetical protein